MSCYVPSINELLCKASEIFTKKFSSKANIAVCAPGRVNLIGEHTDYNNGFVLPMALPLVTVVVGDSSKDNKCSIVATDYEDEFIEFNLPLNKRKSSSGHWSSYVEGVLANFCVQTKGFRAVISSSVPIGGGLSSSAALEVAIYTFLELLNNVKAESLKEKALACQKAEHEYANVPCGIMDQFISTLGQSGNALLIDCGSLESTLVPVNSTSTSFVIINSNVKHSLSNSEYPVRRKHCFEAADQMGIESLRKISSEEFNEKAHVLDDLHRKRARHVITENMRTLMAAETLRNKDFETFGKLMSLSHASLRDDYEVSCKELDQLVQIALSVSGVYGSRMTGGGFGGCTVTLVKKENVNELIRKIMSEYSGSPTIYVCQPSDGAKVLMKP